MSYTPTYNTFIFESYSFDVDTCVASFAYSFDGTRHFTEQVQFTKSESHNEATLDSALFMAWIIAGISYYKAFPTKVIEIRNRTLTTAQADFFTSVYVHGLSQFVYENELHPDDIAQFEGRDEKWLAPALYEGEGTLVLQSGGKDSLLLAQLLKKNNHDFTIWYMTQGSQYPNVLDTIRQPLRQVTRTIDREALVAAKQDGGLNGHVPVTFITLSYAIVDAILHNEHTVLAAIGNEGEEPHAYIGDYPVTHQWSKTWAAETMLAEYVSENIASEVRVGSPLRAFTELKITELFAEHLWHAVGRMFSSCNLANYKQGHGNHQLTWCAECPKCANSYLLFAPFVPRAELNDVFGKDMFEDDTLTATFKGLLGVDGVEKPFECVGEVEELRSAYHAAIEKGYTPLPIVVPHTSFNRDSANNSQQWAYDLIRQAE